MKTVFLFESADNSSFNMDAVRGTILSYISLLFCVVWIPTGLIRSYLNHKPIGLQTFLDHASVEATYVIQLGMCSFCFLGVLGVLTTR